MGKLWGRSNERTTLRGTVDGSEIRSPVEGKVVYLITTGFFTVVSRISANNSRTYPLGNGKLDTLFTLTHTHTDAHRQRCTHAHACILYQDVCTWYRTYQHSINNIYIYIYTEMWWHYPPCFLERKLIGAPLMPAVLLVIPNGFRCARTPLFDLCFFWGKFHQECGCCHSCFFPVPSFTKRVLRMADLLAAHRDDLLMRQPLEDTQKRCVSWCNPEN